MRIIRFLFALPAWMLSILVFIVLPALALTVLSIVYLRDTHTDVSHRPEFWGGYEQGKIYTLNFDVFLIREGGVFDIGKTGYLAAAGNVSMPFDWQYQTPPSINYYRTGGQARNERGDIEQSYRKLRRMQGFNVEAHIRGAMRNTIGIVEKGTRIQATHVMLTDGNDFLLGPFNQLHVFGDILDGPYAGRNVGLRALSEKDREFGKLFYSHKPLCVAFCDFSNGGMERP